MAVSIDHRLAIVPGTWVATRMPIVLSGSSRTWTQATGVRRLPVNTIGFVASIAKSGRRYVVTFPGSPPLTLSLRGLDFAPVHVELLVRHMHDGRDGLLFAEWGDSGLASLPDRETGRRHRKPDRPEVPERPTVDEILGLRPPATQRREA